ncbi:hypothetical protein [Carboxylicivirga sp. RSCT41]|uniref:hypothetical protein n=1 Tax=Carboxylicivirga agarovorans TaxID=3417570 RepID=UPI003D327C8E
MNKLIYQLLFLGCMILSLIACNEDKLEFDPVEPKYDLSDSDDPLQHLKYVFNQNYGVIVIDDVDISDYQYTGGKKLDLTVGNCSKSKDEKVTILEAIEKSFYSNNEYFANEFAPLKLILADSIGGMVEKYNWKYDPVTGWQRVAELVFERQSYYVEGPLSIISTANEELEIQEDGTILLFDKWGRATNFEAVMMEKILFDNILEPKYGNDWALEFAPLYGKYAQANPNRDFIRWDWSDTMGDFYDTDEQNQLFIFPSADFPGGYAEQDDEAIMDFVYSQGFPVVTQVYFWPTTPGGRVRVFMDDIVVSWLKFSGREDKDELLAQYPELQANYLVAQQLFEELIGMEI